MVDLCSLNLKQHIQVYYQQLYWEVNGSFLASSEKGRMIGLNANIYIFGLEYDATLAQIESGKKLR